MLFTHSLEFHSSRQLLLHSSVNVNPGMLTALHVKWLLIPTIVDNNCGGPIQWKCNWSDYCFIFYFNSHWCVQVLEETQGNKTSKVVMWIIVLKYFVTLWNLKYKFPTENYTNGLTEGKNSFTRLYRREIKSITYPPPPYFVCHTLGWIWVNIFKWQHGVLIRF